MLAYNQENKYLNVSEKYKHITTKDIGEVLGNAGFTMVNYQEAKPRKDKAFQNGFTKHIARYRNESLQIGDGLNPELVVMNDHRGTASLKIMLGIFRLICTNGLVAGTTHGMFSVKHVGDVKTNLNNAVNSSIDSYKRISENILTMQQTQLNQDQKLTLAKTIGDIRLTDIETKGKLLFEPEALLNARRQLDTKSDAFTVMNVIQENVIRNGLRYQEVIEGAIVKTQLTRRLKDNSPKAIELNKMLWDTTLTQIGV